MSKKDKQKVEALSEMEVIGFSQRNENPKAKFRRQNARPRSCLRPDKDGITQQSDRDGCDLNLIMRSASTGIPMGLFREKRYGDQKSDFHTMQIAIASAKSAYEELSPEHMERFTGVHDFIDALANSERAKELEGIPYFWETYGEELMIEENEITEAANKSQEENKEESASDFSEESRSESLE